MPDLPPITRAEILAEIARELGMRRNLYPRWIAEGKITAALAAQRIERLQSAYDFIMEAMPTYFEGKR